MKGTVGKHQQPGIRYISDTVPPTDAKPGDLRVWRTRKMLRQAMMEPVGEKDYADITIRDLSQRAMINRSTFYRHYLDKDSLARDCLVELLQRFAREVPVPGPEEGLRTNALVSILEEFRRQGDFFRGVLGRDGTGPLAPEMRKHLKQMYRERLAARGYYPQGQERVPVEIVLDFTSHAVIAVISRWLHAKQPEPPEQLAHWLGHLVVFGSFHALGMAQPRFFSSD